MVINQSLLNQLTEQAKASPRLRMNYDLRNSEDDGSQRMLNAIEPGSEMPIHRHQHTSETVVCLRGCLVEEFFDELERICTERIIWITVMKVIKRADINNEATATMYPFDGTN